MDQQGTRRGRHAPRRVLSGTCRPGECPARHSNSVANSAGLAYIDSTITGASSIGAILLIAQDTTPGQEFFCWALKTTGGNDELHRDCCHAV